jgi:hypothetical protein
MSNVYIVIKNERCYSSSDWEIIGVHKTLEESKLHGWLQLVDQCLKPWKIKFYTDRDGEFKDCIGVSDYHIEKWDILSNKKDDVWYLGFNKHKSLKYTNYIDALIKSQSTVCESLLREWQTSMTDNGIVPDALKDLTFMKES